MKTYNLDEVKTSTYYKSFLSDNKGLGILKIRAYTASEALPIKNLYVTVSKVIDDKNIIFYEGTTNDSGIIDNIKLPAPKVIVDNQITPNSTSYKVKTKYMNQDYSDHTVTIYENILVVQNINVVPNINMENGNL